jgi:hypothetical protein
VRVVIFKNPSAPKCTQRYTITGTIFLYILKWGFSCQSIINGIVISSTRHLSSWSGRIFLNNNNSNKLPKPKAALWLGMSRIGLHLFLFEQPPESCSLAALAVTTTALFFFTATPNFLQLN